MEPIMVDDIIEELHKITQNKSEIQYRSLYEKKSISTIDEAYEFIKKWIPEISDKEKINISQLDQIPDSVTQFFNIYLPYGNDYLKYMKPYIPLLTIKEPKPIEVDFPGSKYYDPYSEDPILAGYFAFMISLIYIMHFPNWNQYLEAIYCYSLIYILVDNYLDDIDINHGNKEEFIKQIYELLDKPTFTKITDPRLIQCGLLYNKIITQFPKSKIGFLISFKHEIEGLKIQSKDKLSRDTYYNNCIKKGGKYATIIHYIISESNYGETFNIGSVIQLMDDCTDVINDIKNGHHTIATYEYIRNGNIDNLWIDIINRIQSLDSKFTIIKFVFSLATVWIVATMPYCYSDYLKEKIKNITPFILEDNFICSKLLYDYITEKLNDTIKE
jgi:hypothetical protein